ncbi:MAG: pyrroloquinoline quinone precursor peptide PqqA [Methylibium sp.]
MTATRHSATSTPTIRWIFKRRLMRRMVSAGRAPACRRFQKIMRRESWPGPCPPAALVGIMNHELTGNRSLRSRRTGPVPPQRRRFDMQWQKPQATDLRYGFEITMYISNR